MIAGGQAVRRSGVLVMSLLLLGTPVDGQEPTRLPSFALTGGLGNVIGGLGAGAEYYFAQSHLSASLGMGYWPSDLCDGAAAGGAAIRGFIGGRHRGFLEASYSVVSIACDFDGSNIDRRYGPGLSVGYRYTGSDGFTFTAGAGVGVRDLTGDPGAESLILLGVGYTWRREYR